MGKRCWLLGVALLVACGGSSAGPTHAGADAGDDSSAGTSGTGGVTGTAGTSGAAGSTGGASASAGWSGTGGVSGTAGSPGGAGVSGSSGAGGEPHTWEGPCSGQDCGPDLYCEFQTGNCEPDGFYFSSGFCNYRPMSCSTDDAPVCGCDGSIYANECTAKQAGVYIGDVCDASLTPQGLFPCGGHFCDPTGAYCLHGLGDQGDETFACVSLPASCLDAGTSADCSCIVLTWPNTACRSVQGGGVTGIMVDQVLM